jgi:hypothetical protein
MDIVILHFPTMYIKPEIPDDMKPIIKTLSKQFTVHNYFFKFCYYGNRFNLDDLDFENAALNIHETFKHLNKYLIVAINHACPYGLYYTSIYQDKCLGIICYPYRFYCKESYERRIWKLKDNNGWSSFIKNSKKYDIGNYLLNITNERLQTLFDNPSDDEKSILYLIMDFNLQKQYYKIPSKFSVLTILYTRLDIDAENVIKYNFDRKDMASMKQLFSVNDALQASMVWNFDRVKYDALLKKENKDNNNLKIKYLVSGWEDINDVFDEIILFDYKSNKRIKEIKMERSSKKKSKRSKRSKKTKKSNKLNGGYYQITNITFHHCF